MVDKLRSRNAVILSLVAVEGDEVIGHILFSPVSLEPAQTAPLMAGLAPIAVIPAWQRKGVGSMLERAGLEECRRLGYGEVIVLEHAEYYPGFGSVKASEYGLRCEYDITDEVFMALELREGALSGVSGTVRYQPEFSLW